MEHDFNKTSGETFASLYKDSTLADVTLVSGDNQLVSGHKIILSSGSPFLKKLINTNRHKHLLQVNGCYKDLCLIVQFIYTGSCEVEQGDLDRFLETARHLEIYGLCPDIMENRNSDKIGSSFVQASQSLELFKSYFRGQKQF